MSRDRKRAQLIDSIFDHPRYAHVIIIINVVAKRNCLLSELYARKIMNKVKKVISLILESPEYLLDTPRNTITRRAATELLDAATENEEIFCKFASALINRIEKIFPVKKYKRRPKERVLSRFHSIVFSDLEKVWDNLYRSLGKQLTVDRMLKQFTNQKLFDDIYISYFTSNDESEMCTSPALSLSTDEDNIIRYIAGYVPFKLFKKYEKKSSEKASSYIECLSHMKVNGNEGSFATYATAWIEEMNRGGLFEINDVTYSLFRMLEMLLREGEPLVLSKEELLKKIEESTDIQFQWSLLSVDIDDDECAQELLKEICSIWLSIRCNALTRRWMESYKQTKKKSTKRSKSLRKQLKLKSIDIKGRKKEDTEIEEEAEEEDDFDDDDEDDEEEDDEEKKELAGRCGKQ